MSAAFSCKVPSAMRRGPLCAASCPVFHFVEKIRSSFKKEKAIPREEGNQHSHHPTLSFLLQTIERREGRE